MRKGIIFPLIIIAAVAIGGLLYLYGGAAFHPSFSTPTGERPNGAYTVLAQGQHAGSIDQRVNYRITDADQFATLWRMIYPTNDQSMPKVDFSAKEVLAVFDGSHSTGGYNVAVKDFKEVQNRRVLYVTYIEPGDSCSPSSNPSSPFVLLLVDKSPLPLGHEEAAEVSHCP